MQTTSKWVSSSVLELQAWWTYRGWWQLEEQVCGQTDCYFPILLSYCQMCTWGHTSEANFLSWCQERRTNCQWDICLRIPYAKSWGTWLDHDITQRKSPLWKLPHYLSFEASVKLIDLRNLKGIQLKRDSMPHRNKASKSVWGKYEAFLLVSFIMKIK